MGTHPIFESDFDCLTDRFFMPGSFRDSAGKLFNSFRRKKKSKALHNSPIQRLCISTQSLARATSLSSLDHLEDGVHDREMPDDREMHDREMYDRHQRGSSCPIPSSGNSQTSGLGKPPRHSKDSLSTKSLNERNDLVETLRHENAGLKEKLSRLSQSEKKPKKKRKSRDSNSTKDESFHGQGDDLIVHEIIHEKSAQNVQAVPRKPTPDTSKLSANVEKSASENTVQFSSSSKTMMSHSTEDSLNGPVNERLVYVSGQKSSNDEENNYFQKMFESSKEENLLMNKKIANQIEEIDRLQQENKSLKEASRRTLDELDGFKTEFENGKSVADRLSRELFETRYSTSSKINEQEESIINLERQIRDLESENSNIKTVLEVTNKQRHSLMDKADHTRIIERIQSEFSRKLNEIALNEGHLRDEISKRDDALVAANEKNVALTQKLSETEFKMEVDRQKRLEEFNQVNPLVVENELLRNQNGLLSKRIAALTREVEDGHRQISLLESESFRRSASRSTKTPNGGTDDLKVVFSSMQNDWQNIVSLLSEVESEKSRQNESANQIMLQLSQRNRELEHRERQLENRERNATQMDTFRELLESRNSNSFSGR